MSDVSSPLSLSSSQCVTCASCNKWFHKTCMSDHHSVIGGRGTWRCVSCTHCVSCKTTSPSKEVRFIRAT